MSPIHKCGTMVEPGSWGDWRCPTCDEEYYSIELEVKEQGMTNETGSDKTPNETNVETMLAALATLALIKEAAPGTQSHSDMVRFLAEQLEAVLARPTHQIDDAVASIARSAIRLVIR